MEAWLEDMFALRMAPDGVRLPAGQVPAGRAYPGSLPDDALRQARPLEARQEREALYAELGWEYLTNQADRYRIYICRDPAVPELETGPGGRRLDPGPAAAEGAAEPAPDLAGSGGRGRLCRLADRKLETPVETAIRGVGISAPLSAVLLVWAVWRR